MSEFQQPSGLDTRWQIEQNSAFGENTRTSASMKSELKQAIVKAGLLAAAVTLVTSPIKILAQYGCTDEPSTNRWCVASSMIIQSNVTISPAVTASDAPYDSIVCVGASVTATLNQTVTASSNAYQICHTCSGGVATNYCDTAVTNAGPSAFNITNLWERLWWNAQIGWSGYSNGFGNSTTFVFTNATAGYAWFNLYDAYMPTNPYICGFGVEPGPFKSYAFVEVVDLSPDAGTLVDTNPVTYAACVVPTNAAVTNITVTATPSPGMYDKFLPSGWEMTGGLETTNSDPNDQVISRTKRLVDITTNGVTDITCESGLSSKEIKVIVVDTKITEPLGSLTASTNPPASWKTSPCYHFDFQGVASNSPGPYVLDIAGSVRPSPAGYLWSLDSAAGTLSNTNSATPTHHAPGTSGQGALTLQATYGTNIVGCSDQKDVKIYTDHLERDHANFGVGTFGGGPPTYGYSSAWSFTNFGAIINMPQYWNCHGGTWHLFDGSGNGMSGSVPGWAVAVQETLPLTAAKLQHIQTNIARGDVVAYYVNNGTLAHSQTVWSGTTCYGANNIPVSATHGGFPGVDEAWTWAESEAGKWADNVNAQFNPITVKVLKRP